MMNIPSSCIHLPSQDELRNKYVGTPIDALPTPSVLIDRQKVLYNIKQMQHSIDQWQCLLRVHIKTHKTKEGVALQLSQSKQKAIIVSTLAEAWGVVSSDLIETDVVDDILYGVPIGIHKIDEMIQLRQAIKSKSEYADLKLIVDSVVQVEALQKKVNKDPILVFIKIDGGYNRAGLAVDSPLLPELIRKITQCDQIKLHGVYTHAGMSYKSTNRSMTSNFLKGELQCVDEAAQIVAMILEEQKDSQRHRIPLILSVGSTPTAHAATNGGADLSQLRSVLHGELELHPGNYAFLDLQQVSTAAVPSIGGVAAIDRCAMTVLTSVISVYPGRGLDGVAKVETSSKAFPHDEALCDAGGIALSKDTGQFSTFGHVIRTQQYVGWQIGRVAQEHGILTMRQGDELHWANEWGRTSVHADSSTKLTMTIPTLVRVGVYLEVIPQHACMVASAHPWFFIYDSFSMENNSSASVPKVVDVWIPWKGW